MTFLHTSARRALLAKRFGANVTKPEIILHGRMGRDGFRFKSQWQIETKNGHFKVDFLVTQYKGINGELIVEVRGESHYSETGQRKDTWKTQELNNAGYPVLWIENAEVYSNLNQVIEKIRKTFLKQRELTRDGYRN